MFLIPDTVVFARVCEVPLLAATRDQYEETDTAACLLNEAGEFIWHEIEKGASEEEILRHTADYFEEDPEGIRPEVLRFLDALEQQQFLRRAFSTESSLEES